MSHLFQQVMHELNIKKIKFGAYHPQFQRDRERFHQTLKNMMMIFCLDSQTDWSAGFLILLLIL